MDRKRIGIVAVVCLLMLAGCAKTEDGDGEAATSPAVTSGSEIEAAATQPDAAAETESPQLIVETPAPDKTTEPAGGGDDDGGGGGGG